MIIHQDILVVKHFHVQCNKYRNLKIIEKKKNKYLLSAHSL